MIEIPDTLRLLFSSEIEQRDGRYLIKLPADQIDRSNPAIRSGEQYRVAIIKPPDGSEQATDSSEAHTESKSKSTQGPPVKAGDVRTVTIEAIGDQGDGIAKVERGYVVIVPGGEPGDELTVRIEDVRKTVGFAEMISGHE
ncbi:TRAM domain-containing protein [Natronorarus salvus]|uniref:TRAM domain-containing protein n=1 Tax=Natronorarus salvus TaxID=3117733 RepID=UPI002F25FCF8